MREQGHIRRLVGGAFPLTLIAVTLVLSSCASALATAPAVPTSTPTPLLVNGTPAAKVPLDANSELGTTRGWDRGDEARLGLRGPYGWAWQVSVPANRIMAYYFIPYAPWGFMGTYMDDPDGDALLLSRIQQQSQGYADLDPAHPIVNAIDIATPVVQADPGPDGYWTAFTPDDVMQHYYNLATSHHMLFFVDIQLGRMPVEKALQELWPWIQLPNVGVALDPEFDVAPSGIPDRDLGIMHASEINRAVDMLSALVAQRNLPPKILVVHQWAFPSLPDWYNVKLNPNVSIITCSDGFGAPQTKIEGDYAVFDKKQLIQYPGFKLFYPNWPGQRGDHPELDNPLMQPADVLNLDPTPVFVMYQ